ncbi:MAG: excinuclease subunit, partial [Chloroflexota bacterium]|nr:excinuclease subunit [Chloroflexota bacterium]
MHPGSYDQLVPPDLTLPYGTAVVRKHRAASDASDRQSAKPRRTERLFGPSESEYRLPMPDFKLVAPFEPTGDQPVAIERLVDGLQKGLKHQTLLGATGTGKSLIPSEPILIGRQDDLGAISWRLEPIGPFVDQVMADRPTYQDDNGTEAAFAGPAWPGHVVVAVDPETCRPVVRAVTAVSRHDSPDHMWRVHTTDGREVTVTGDHNFVVLGSDARLQVRETVRLQPGDAIPVPRIPDSGSMTRVDVAADIPAPGIYVTGPDVLG